MDVQTLEPISETQSYDQSVADIMDGCPAEEESTKLSRVNSAAHETVAKSAMLSRRPVTASIGGSYHNKVYRTQSELPENLCQILRDTSKPVSYMGVNFQATKDASGAFSLSRSLALNCVDVSGDNQVDHLLADIYSTGSKNQLVSLPSTYSLEAMCLMASRLKMNVRNKHIQVRLSVQVRLAEECIRRGEVTCFVDVKSRGGKPSVQLQASKESNTRDAFIEREMLRHHPEIKQIISDWFFALPRTATGELGKEQYIKSGVAVAKKLCPHESDATVMQAVLEDWNNDAGPRPLLTYQMWEDGIFQLVDLWCEGQDVENYVVFLRGLYKTAQKNSKWDKMQAWHVLKHVMEIPRTMQTLAGSRTDVLSDREELCAWMVDDIMKLIYRPYKTARGLTKMELQAYLVSTPYGPFSKWLVRTGGANWRKFDKNSDGRLTRTELSEALKNFLSTDGFGRELERQFTPEADVKASLNTSTRPSSAPATTTRAERAKIAMLKHATGMSSPDPRRAPRHAHAYRKRVGDKSKGGHSDSHEKEMMDEHASANQWWLHMKMIRRCFKVLMEAGSMPQKSPHWRKNGMLISKQQMERAKEIFHAKDLEKTGLVDFQVLVVGLSSLIPGRSVLELKEECIRLFTETNLTTGDNAFTGSLDVNEFVSLYNAISVEETDIGDFY